MAWSLEKKWRLVPRFPYVHRYEWSLFQSAYGSAVGSTLTRKQAEQQMRNVQSDWFAS